MPTVEGVSNCMKDLDIAEGSAKSDKSSSTAPSACPKVAPLSKEMKQLPLEEKQKLVADEAKSLLDFCKSSGFTTEQLTECMNCLRGEDKLTTAHKTMRDSRTSLFKVALLIGVVSFISLHSPSYNMFCVHAKLLQVQTLPYWDWRWIYKEDCLFINNYIVSKQKNITESDCLNCLDVQEKVDRFSNATDSNLIWKDYLSKQVPFVVTDTMQRWKEREVLHMDKIVELYTNKEELSAEAMATCSVFSADSDIKIHEFIGMFRNGALPATWAVSWENCVAPAAKVLRVFYERPYFMPDLAGGQPGNAIIAASGVEKAIWNEVALKPGEDSALWLTVISGSLRLRLQPPTDCEKFGCKEVFVILKTGQTVTYTQEWGAQYQSRAEELIAIVSTVQWDK